MSSLSEAQQRLIQWLYDHGGSGVVDQRGGVIARGERRNSGYASTFLRLFTMGHIESDGPLRLRLTERGRSAAEKPGNPTSATRERDWSDPRVREAFIGDEDTITNVRDAR